MLYRATWRIGCAEIRLLSAQVKRITATVNWSFEWDSITFLKIRTLLYNLHELMGIYDFCAAGRNERQLNAAMFTVAMLSAGLQCRLHKLHFEDTVR
jgi:hypothetical protein